MTKAAPAPGWSGSGPDTALVFRSSGSLDMGVVSADKGRYQHSLCRLNRCLRWVQVMLAAWPARLNETRSSHH
jgi:hypothetical protein